MWLAVRFDRKPLPLPVVKLKLLISYIYTVSYPSRPYFVIPTLRDGGVLELF